MNGIELLKLEAAEAFRELMESIQGVSEQQSWARVECRPGEYMHTENSILSNVVHVASCKFMYASAAYRHLEIRQRDTLARLEQIWPSWDAAKEWLVEAQVYWMLSWAEESDLEREVLRFDGAKWPSWLNIWTMCHHDSYHAGQIQLLRSTLILSESPPPDETAIWRKYCEPLPTW